jgi:hypothetical protein
LSFLLRSPQPAASRGQARRSTAVHGYRRNGNREKVTIGSYPANPIADRYEGPDDRKRLKTKGACMYHVLIRARSTFARPITVSTSRATLRLTFR